MKPIALLLAAASLLGGCAAGPGRAAPLPACAPVGASTTPQRIAALKPLGRVDIERAPGLLQHFGGISGAERDPVSGQWLLLSDDRSERAPARLYTASIALDQDGLHEVRLTGRVELRQPDGSRFARSGAAGEVADPEALRIDPLSGCLTWASEGDGRLGLNPFIRQAGRDGSFVRTLALPPNLRFDASHATGPRHNMTLEGLAYSADGRELWSAMEAPLFQDGPLADTQRGALARITRATRDGAVLAQYAYPLDAVPLAASGGARRADNGITEVLAYADRLLVVERSGREVADGVFRFAVRLYEADMDGADDVQGRTSLEGAALAPAGKRLLLDLRQAGLGEIDNIEAAAWGPRLANGHATLVLLSDDNFSPAQRNQVLAFEVLE